MPGHDILQSAVGATTPADAETVQKMTAEAIAAGSMRPLGDKPNNCGLITAARGEFEHPGGET